MAHFAEIGLNNVVQRVIVVDNSIILNENGIEQESLGQEFCRNLLGGSWIQTSYNGSFRKNFAGIGFTYNSERDAFIPPKPFESWILNEETCQWQAPTLIPDDGNTYTWNEETVSWNSIVPE